MPTGHDQGVTRDRLDVILQHCADVGVHVEWIDLGPKRRGVCISRSGVIVLNTRLTAAQAASTAAHEFAHWCFGDRKSTPAVERRAWQYGASLLFEPEEYEAAERIVGTHPTALAVELEVTATVVEHWREWWRSKGSTQPRFAHLLLELEQEA